MESLYLVNSCLRLSLLSYGNSMEQDDDKRTVEFVKTSLEQGVNFFKPHIIICYGLNWKIFRLSF